MKPVSRAKVLRWLERFFLLLAVIGLGGYGYFWIERRVYQSVHSHSFERPPGESPSQVRDTAAPDTPIGRIEIPRLGVTSVILEGVGERALRLGVGRIPGTAALNQDGNVGLAGHRDTVFGSLGKLRKNDKVRLSGPEGAKEYIVDWIAVVPPENTRVLDPRDTPTVTLVTCYPFDYVGSAKMRYVVQARRADVPLVAAVRNSEEFTKPLPYARASSHLPSRDRQGAVVLSPRVPPVATPEPVSKKLSLASTSESPVPIEAKKERRFNKVSRGVRKGIGWLIRGGRADKEKVVGATAAKPA